MQAGTMYAATLRQRGFYYVGCALLAVKAAIGLATIFHTGLVNPHSVSALPRLLWLCGKVVPELLCIAFLIDAVQNRRARWQVWFWAVLTVVVPFFALYFAIKQAVPHI